MTNFEVLVSESARKDFYELGRIQKRVKQVICLLKENPFRSRSGADIKKLQGSFNPAVYRVRVGNYRLLYVVEGKVVKITRIIHRKDGYGWL